MTTIDLSTLKPDIKRHLSVIGKRAVDATGKNIFSDITVSTAEDPIFDKYTAEAIQHIAGLLGAFVKIYTSTSLTIDAERWKPGLLDALQDAIKDFTVIYVVCEYLKMTRPDIAEKYNSEVALKTNNIVTLAYYKDKPAQSASSYSDVKGAVAN